MTRPGRKRVKKGGNYSKTPESERRHIAMIVLRENLTLDEAFNRFGHSRQTINRWVHLYYDEIEQITVMLPMSDNAVPSLPPSEQDMEYEAKLQAAQLKITALETMIDLAEQTYKIAIRKNSGTKQPRS